MQHEKPVPEYVDRLIHDWRLDEQSECFQARVRRVLLELGAGAQLSLVGEPTLEVRVLADRCPSVWAFFPFHRGRYNVRRFSGGFIPPLKPNTATRILLVFNSEKFEKQADKQSKEDLRHHLGHALLFLREPKAPNECSDAQKEWRASISERSARAKAKNRFAVMTTDAANRRAVRKYLLTGEQPQDGSVLNRPLTAEGLRALRDRLSKMTERELVKFYEDALFVCELDHGVPPRAAFIQQFVASWKEMQRRRKVKA